MKNDQYGGITSRIVVQDSSVQAIRIQKRQQFTRHGELLLIWAGTKGTCGIVLFRRLFMSLGRQSQRPPVRPNFGVY
jgi:hypothetical protein